MEEKTFNLTKAELLKLLANQFGRMVTPQLLSAIREKMGAAIAQEFDRATIYDQRLTRWTDASPFAARFEQFMPLYVQQLGRVDCRLMREDDHFRDLSQKEQQSIPEMMLLNERFAVSHYWVLGAYEIVRTMHQRATDRRLLPPTQVAQLGRLKNSLARLRMPLAKMEPKQSHKATDSPIAYNAMHREFGIAWQLTPTLFVSRRELSDSLLGFLEAGRATSQASSTSESTRSE